MEKSRGHGNVRCFAFSCNNTIQSDEKLRRRRRENISSKITRIPLVNSFERSKSQPTHSPTSEEDFFNAHFFKSQ